MSRPKALYLVLTFAIPACLFGALVTLYASGNKSLYYAILSGLGFPPYDFPFLDLHALLAAADCHRLGLDVYLSNPCDVRGRPHVYSPLWLDLIPGFLNRDRVNQIGVVLDLMLIASLPFIMRPRSAGQWLLFTVATLSTPVVYLLERANNDIVIFLLAVCAGALLAGSRLQRFAAYLVFAFAGLLKFYPLALLVLVVRETWLRACTIITISVVAFLGLWWVHGHELALVLGHLPRVSYYSDSISARNLPFGLAGRLPPTTLMSEGLMAALIFVILIAYSGVLALRTYRVLARDGKDLPDASRATWYLLIGIIVLAGCFFSGENVAYRGVFLLLVIPGLLNFQLKASATRLRRLLGVVLSMVLFLLWEQRIGLSINHVFNTSISDDPNSVAGPVPAIYWICRESLWWALNSIFVAMIVFLASRMPLLVKLALLLPKSITGSHRAGSAR